MTYKQTLTAFEAPIDGESLIARMLEHKRAALTKGILLPDNFIAAVESFAQRNSLSSVHPECDERSACPRCLKAFTISEAYAHGLTKEARNLLKAIMPGEIGHNGYYLDNEEVKPVQPQV